MDVEIPSELRTRGEPLRSGGLRALFRQAVAGIDRPNQDDTTESSRRMVSSRSDPVEMMAAGTPLTSSSRRT
jgi:hypothetical protein